MSLFLLVSLAAAPDTVRAAPAAPVPRLDGRLDDAAWAAATPVTRFVQRLPDWNAPGTERTEARILAGGDALYVGIRAWDREPARIVAPLGRRDELMPSDRVGVFIDSWYDRRTAFAFLVNPAGVKLDRYYFDDNQMDPSWDATWDVAVARDAEGWSAEFRIPFSQLRFAGGRAPRFGLNILRTVARRGEEQLWRIAPQDLSQFVSRFGELEGLTDVRPPRRLEVVPYLLGRETLDATRSGNPFRPSRAESGTIGADLRLGLGPSLTLAAAVNPDFGQIDGDLSEVNLGPGELFFAERRPFFAEASDVFRVGLSGDAASAEAVVYSRRIGRAPQISADPRGGWSHAPRETTILGAGKLTGKTASGWTIGALTAITEEERAQVATVDGRRFSDLVEPRTFYGAGRLAKDFRGGRTVLGLIGTLVHRGLDSVGGAVLRREAMVAGVDLAHRWGAGNAYQLRTSLFGSRVAGSREAILATQLSSQRYYQRPDDDGREVDSTATAMSGVSGLVAIERRTGPWRWHAQSTLRSPSYEGNDIGFHYWAGRAFTDASVTRLWNGLPWAQTAQLKLLASHVNTWEGDRVNASLSLQGRATFRNNWYLNAGAWRRHGGRDPWSLRGGPSLAFPGNNYGYANLETDPNRKIRFALDTEWYVYDEGTREGYGAVPTVIFRPSTRSEFSVGVRYEVMSEDRQYLGEATLAGRRTYLVGEVDQRIGALNIRGSLVFSPTLSLQLWAEPFTTSGRYRAVKRVADPHAAREADRFAPVTAERTDGRLRADLDGDGAVDVDVAEPDLTSLSLRSNLVLRWEFRPSSTLFVVWQQERTGSRLDGRFRPGGTLGELAGLPSRNQLAVKASWWWTPR